MPTINWKNLGTTSPVSAGQTILDAAIESDIPLSHACGGFCACTTCHVIVLEGAQNLSTIEEDESDRLEGKLGVQLKSRLACQAKVHGDITIEIPR